MKAGTEQNNGGLSFSPAQEEAVSYGEGPLLVLAGPGSGKTFVITQRVRHLIEARGVNPSRILVVTFSRAAAREMEERFLAFGLRVKGRVTFGTFHSFFFGILRTAYGYSADQVADDETRMNIVLGLIREKRIESEDVKNLARNLLSEIASVKEERAEIAHYYAACCPAETFREIFASYEETLGSLRKIDYEDMLLMTYELLSQREDIRKACAARWQWILVDEFQDINRLQYEIVRMIAGERKNLTIVGDDDQSIYRFRGARPEIMLGFERDYPGAKRVLLDVNYRSTPEIVLTAGRLINKNRRRFRKEIRAFRGHGKPVNTVVCPDPQSEAEYIADTIRSRVKKGELRYGDVAVLYRTNLQPRLLSAKLMQENVPFRMREMLPDLMDHWIAKDISSYLRLAFEQGTVGDLIRIMNRPNRYIRRDALREDGLDFNGIRRYYFRMGQHWMKERIDRLETDLKLLRRKNVYEAIRYIRDEMGYDGFLKKYAEEHAIEETELFEVIEEVHDSADGFQVPEEWFSHLKEFRKELLLKREKAGRAAGKEGAAAQQEETAGAPGMKGSAGAGDETEGAEEDAVHLMTFHASKGLEFPLVFIIDANEGVVPHRKAGTRDELEEERRMFYVAMTRAKDELVICTLKKRFKREVSESPFIAEYEK